MDWIYFSFYRNFNLEKDITQIISFFTLLIFMLIKRGLGFNLFFSLISPLLPHWNRIFTKKLCLKNLYFLYQHIDILVCKKMGIYMLFKYVKNILFLWVYINI